MPTVTQLLKKLKLDMDNWTVSQRSLAGYQEKLGNNDARVAILGGALTVEGYRDRIDDILVSIGKDKRRSKCLLDS